MKLAEAGIHTFCEKPLTSLEPEEFANYSKTVSDSAKKKGIFLSVGYMFRYEANLVPLKNILSLTLLPFLFFANLYRLDTVNSKHQKLCSNYVILFSGGST